jgi:hypothetical protein
MLVNFKDNNGILVTIKADSNRENKTIARGIDRKDFIISELPYSPARATEITASAFAGVGNPLKMVVCVLSKLNLASLKPAHTGIMEGTRIKQRDPISKIEEADVVSWIWELLRKW